MHDPHEDDIRALLHDARRLEGEPPSFDRLWRHAQRPGERRRPRLVFVPALGAALALLWAVSWLGNLRPTQGEAAVETLLASLRAADSTPLDFLLDIPGTELFHGTPRFGQPTPTIDLSPFELQED